MLKVSRMTMAIITIVALQAVFPVLFPVFLAAQSSPEAVQTTKDYSNIKKVPIAIEKIRIGIETRKVIGEIRRGLFGIVDRQWFTEDLGDGSRFINTVYKALTDEGYTPAVEALKKSAPQETSVFSNIEEDSQPKASSQARFLVGGTITKTWMTVQSDGWGGWSTDIDMNVKWELYDAVQKKVIFTQNIHAVDAGGGMTDAYFQTVMKKSAEKLFQSPEFAAALQKALATSSSSSTGIEGTTSP